MKTTHRIATFVSLCRLVGDSIVCSKRDQPGIEEARNAFVPFMGTLNG